MPRLSNLFRPSAARPAARQARLGVEALSERLVPSVTFHEDAPTHTVILNAAAHQNNTVAIRNDGNGGLTITADGVTRTFTGVKELDVATGDGADTVTYAQGTAGQAANLRRDFALIVGLGANAAGTTDRFTATVFGDVGFFQDGAFQPEKLKFGVRGEDGHDRIAINVNHDTDVRPGSQLDIAVDGGGGNDNLTVDYDGRLDGRLRLLAIGDGGNDLVAANLHLDAGSGGSVRGFPDAGDVATVRGDLGNDAVTLAVRVDPGAAPQVAALVDGGFGFGFPDHDVGRHTANVATAFLEQDILVT